VAVPGRRPAWRSHYEWRKVWQLAGLVNPEAITAFLTAFWMTLLSRWCRPCKPVFRFLKRCCWGKTHCHDHSRAAERYFRSKASGSNTFPQPSDRSFAWIRFTISRCCWGGFHKSPRQHSFPVLIPLASPHRNFPMEAMLGSHDAQQGDLQRDPADEYGLGPLIAAVPGFSVDGFQSIHGCSSISPRPQVLLNQGSNGS
jgi:hypothetical protein